ncbi:MAG: GNAT family N-acetyltransferase [Syntrophobacteraceae bacterium]
MPFPSPRDRHPIYEERKTTAQNALKAIKRGHRVFIGSGGGEPQHLVRALEEIMPTLWGIEIVHIMNVGKTKLMDTSIHDQCRFKAIFVASASHEAVAEGRADYLPVNPGDVPELFRSGTITIDVALVQVTPPDEHGFCSFGVAVDILHAATDVAKVVIAQVNPRMPKTLGDSFIHVRNIDAFVEYEEPLCEVREAVVQSFASDGIGKNVAKLVEDGSTIEVGMGSICSAVLMALEDKKDLGVHADILTDAYLHLVRKGVITNARKTLHSGKIVASLCMGTKKLYDFINDNPMVAFFPIDYTNNHLVISANEKMVSIITALEADLTGQVCIDSIGYEIYGGLGSAVDFLRGAKHSKGGKAIIVLPSTTLDGKRSRIVPAISEGGGVGATRGGVQYVVTEYGIANMLGKSLRDRALAMIDIAHPDFREELMQAAQRLNYIRPDLGHLMANKALYPSEWEGEQELDDGGKIYIRPSKATDERALKEFFYSLPKEAFYYRLLSKMKVFPQYNVHHLVNLDYERQLTVLGLTGKDKGERILGIAQYVLDEESMTAEVDFAVHRSYSRKGVGTLLIKHLAEIAKSRRIRMFVTHITTGNERAFGVFQRLGYVVEGSYSDGIYEVRLYFDLPPQAPLTD